MTRESLIDRIRRELKRQQRPDHFEIEPGVVPDTYHVVGTLDIDALARAIRDER